jgi:hypothetical protein
LLRLLRKKICIINLMFVKSFWKFCHMHQNKLCWSCLQYYFEMQCLQVTTIIWSGEKWPHRFSLWCRVVFWPSEKRNKKIENVQENKLMNNRGKMIYTRIVICWFLVIWESGTNNELLLLLVSLKTLYIKFVLLCLFTRGSFRFNSRIEVDLMSFN